MTGKLSAWVDADPDKPPEAYEADEAGAGGGAEVGDTVKSGDVEGILEEGKGGGLVQRPTLVLPLHNKHNC